MNPTIGTVLDPEKEFVDEKPLAQAAKYLLKEGINLDKVNPKIIEALDKADWGDVTPTITSAYRDKETNARVGGVPDSWHTKGDALDFRSGSLKEAQKLIPILNKIGLDAEFHNEGTGPHTHARLRGAGGDNESGNSDNAGGWGVGKSKGFTDGGESSTAGALASELFNTQEKPTEEKGKFWKNVLPLFLRFVPPAIAGGILGSKSSLGALGGVSTALASSGIGHLKDLGVNRAQAHEKGLKDEENRIDKLKVVADFNDKDRKFALDSMYKKGLLSESEYKRALDEKKFEHDVENDKSHLELDERKLSKEKEAVLNPQEKVFDTLAKMFGDQPIKSTDKAQVGKFLDVYNTLTTKDKKVRNSGGWIGDVEERFHLNNPGAIRGVIDGFNRYVAQKTPKKNIGQNELANEINKTVKTEGAPGVPVSEKDAMAQKILADPKATPDAKARAEKWLKERI